MTSPLPVVIEPYSEQWPRAFASEREVLLAVFDNATVTVEHIGSTAVPGLGAKPTIDILLGAPDLATIEWAIPGLEVAGYRYVPEHEAVLPQRRYLVKPASGAAAFHLHAVAKDTPFWREHLAFRDALRADSHLRDDYHALKCRLAERFGTDRGGYTDAKAPFIRAVLGGTPLA